MTNEKIIEETKNFAVIPNRTKYDYWEMHSVVEHYMVVPKRHAESLDELTAAEQAELMRILAKYEKAGFSLYARGVGFIRRSVKHQHTHLIKASNKEPKFTLFIKKPYWLFRI